MELNRLPAALQDRLGQEATTGFLELLHKVRKECSGEVIGIISDRFERRLIDETSKLRIDMVRGFAGLREELAATASTLRKEMTAESNALRQEMATGFGALRQEMADHRLTS